MKTFFTLLTFCCMMTIGLAQDVAYAHTVTADNVVSTAGGQVTELNHPYLNGNPDANLSSNMFTTQVEARAFTMTTFPVFFMMMGQRFGI